MADKRKKAAHDQRLVFAALFMISIMIVAPFLVRGVIKDNRAKQDAELHSSKLASISKSIAAETTTAQSEDLTEATDEREAEFFKDTLFIGDSRVVGLYEYGNVPNAKFFAQESISLTDLFETSVNVNGIGSCTLDSLLSSYQFKRIYLMCGINDLGNDPEVLFNRYSKIVNLIRQKEPNAELVIIANLHVTKERNESGDFINNTTINVFNAKISTKADGEHIKYIDPNAYFDDDEGNLSEEYSGDSAHIRASVQKDLKHWIMQNTNKVSK